MKLFDIMMQVVGSGLLLALAVMIVRRRLHREYRFFFTYVAYSFLSALFLLCVSGNYTLYFFGYWISDAFGVVLLLLALHEAFHEVFYGFYVFWWFRLIFPGVVAVLTFFAVRHAMIKPASLAPRFMYVIFAIDTAVSYVQAGIFVVFIALVVALRVRWRRYPYDIALGFAICSVGTWVSYVVFWQFGMKYARIARYATPLTYIVATAVWLWSFSGKFEPEPAPEWKHDVAPEQLVEEVKDHIRIMKKVLGRSEQKPRSEG